MLMNKKRVVNTTKSINTNILLERLLRRLTWLLYFAMLIILTLVLK